MDGGATQSKIQEGVQATKELVPLAANYPIAFAMLAVIAFAAGCLWLFARREKARSGELASMVDVNRDQAATLESMATLLEALPTILSYMATVVAVLKINADELTRALAAAKEAAGELSARRRIKRTTGSVVARPTGGALPSDVTPTPGDTKPKKEVPT